jgi:hypothetical protein
VINRRRRDGSKPRIGPLPAAQTKLIRLEALDVSTGETGSRYWCGGSPHTEARAQAHTTTTITVHNEFNR